ncbi:CDP-diacylglycerol--glycerol-3-phosphate 3-phosphatidyltransferase, mitochondrial-like isoform X2 [Lineus longissimus]|uniref:CDP-diacylglycerol--glycerol-3-phosphate 3-phosphatidyltransferase, mitochondrial-like isoform X2 n=1 Tax=Lineus longissimus TaxID=88925 RepID=UPI002B4DE9F9
MATRVVPFSKLLINITSVRTNERNVFIIRRFCRNFSNRFSSSTNPYTPAVTAMTDSEQISARQVRRVGSWLGLLTPCFAVSGKQIKVLKEPAEFYDTLKNNAATAKKRICLASLYLGTGNLEQGLVDSVREALTNASNSPDFKVTILLDYTRGSRGDPCSRTLLLPLLEEFPDQVQVALYHTPDLRGVLKKLLPDRFNETIGLSHLKVYLFDDTLIMSGCNLSESYFTNRQDRYILIRDCPELANFFHGIVDCISSISFQVDQDNKLHLHEDMDHPFEGPDGGASFRATARQRIMDIFPDSCLSFNVDNLTKRDMINDLVSQADDMPVENCCDESEKDTLIYPLIQMGPLGIRCDEIATKVFLRTAKKGSRVCLASGYFNLTDDYKDMIVKSSLADYDVLFASPEVNSFYGAPGIAGAVPAVYIQIAKEFYNQVIGCGAENRISLFEYFRDKWTFHGKGLWYYLPGQSLPCLTLLGSPNFGYRSVNRDLEAQIAVVTRNKELQEQLHEEKERLYKRSTKADDRLFARIDRQIPLWVQWLTPHIKNFF